MKKKISCIMPAYNEGSRISKVLSVVNGHPMVDEIIVVNDGSTDNTLSTLKKFKNIKIINNPVNLGKSKSVMKGVIASKGDFILFLDSDLRGLNKKNITNLILPVKNDLADMSLSLRKNAPSLFRLIGLDYISGERVIKKSLLSDISKLETLPGWAIESAYLNRKVINDKLRLAVVKWPNVESPYPSEKFGFFKGNLRLLKMCWQILKINGAITLLLQIIGMKKRII